MNGTSTMNGLSMEVSQALGNQHQDTKNISFREAYTVIGLSFAGTDTVPPEPMSEFMMEPVGLTEQGTKEHFKTFIMAFPIMESLKIHRAIVIGEREKKDDDMTTTTTTTKENNRKLMSCMVVRDYNTKTNHHRHRFLALKKSWCFLRCTMHFLLMTKHGIPEVFLHRNRNDKDKEKQFQGIADQFDHILSPAWHKKYGPTEPHWYIQFLGVHPSHQGKGCGSRLMQCVADAADKRGIAIYLECSGDKNRSFYETHGYSLVAETTLTDPLDTTRSLRINCMVRKPKK